MSTHNLYQCPALPCAEHDRQRWTATQAAVARRQGVLLREIGDEFGVSAERARQLVYSGERLRRSDLARAARLIARAVGDVR